MTIYIIGMQFISWMIVIMMITGVFLVKASEYDLKNPDSKSDDIEKMALEMFLQEYNEHNLIGRFAFVLIWGARILASPFQIKGRDDK